MVDTNFLGKICFKKHVSNIYKVVLLFLNVEKWRKTLTHSMR